MRDPVDIDLNRYLDEQEAAIEEEEQAEQDLYRDRLQFAMRILLEKGDAADKARRLVRWVEGEIEETIENL
jgi:G3E family GTPase